MLKQLAKRYISVYMYMCTHILSVNVLTEIYFTFDLRRKKSVLFSLIFLFACP